MTGNLQRAAKKLQRNGGNEFCGYLTPSEILALLDAGAEPTPSNEYKVSYTKAAVANGDSKPTWFYFTIDTKVANQLGLDYKHHAE